MLVERHHVPWGHSAYSRFAGTLLHHCMQLSLITLQFNKANDIYDEGYSER